MNPVDLNRWLAKNILVHERALRGFLRRFFAEPSDVEDVIQDTYAKLIALPDEAHTAVRGWHAYLFKVAHNVALDRLRKQRVVSLNTMAEFDTANVLDQRLTPYEEVSARQELALLAAAIASLPDRCREVMTLRKVYGVSQKEIAARIGISESTVEKHVATGVRLCAERMFTTRDDAGTARGRRPVVRDVKDESDGG